MEVVLTRARDDAEGSAARLAALGVSATIVPVTQILSLEWRAPGRIDAVIATSRHAFAGFTGRDVAERAALTALPLYAVGPATAAAAREVGFGDLRVAAGDAQALVDLLVLTNARGRALYLAGVDRKPAGVGRRGQRKNRRCGPQRRRRAALFAARRGLVCETDR